MAAVRAGRACRAGRSSSGASTHRSADTQRGGRWLHRSKASHRRDEAPTFTQSLREPIGSAQGRLRKLFPAVEVSAGVPPGLPPLHVHPAPLEQALFNILENGARFSPPGAPVVVDAHRVGDKLVLDVTDRGPGIPVEERRRIFDMFYSAERGDRGSRGSGLGLTIVRGMIGAHGGRVEALPGPDGVGTTIRVTLPLLTVLALLVRHAGRVVTQQQLLREVWGPTHLEDAHYLRIVVGKIRQKLADDHAHPRYLRTEPGVGYRFVGEPRMGS